MELRDEFGDSVDFAMCYIEEAHPTDGWMYDSVTHFVAQHTTIESRVSASEKLLDELRALRPSGDLPPLVVDTLSNEASLTYGALPERLVVIEKGVVRFIGGKGPEEYSINEARVALAGLVGR